MHVAFEEAKKDAQELNIPVTGSEVVGLVPLKALLGNIILHEMKLWTSILTADAENAI